MLHENHTFKNIYFLSLFKTYIPFSKKKKKTFKNIYFRSLLFLMFSSISVWCRRTDELVDGPNASHITPTALDRWESRLEDLFRGRPFDMLDAALSDTVTKFPVDIQVRLCFQDQIIF